MECFYLRILKDNCKSLVCPTMDDVVRSIHLLWKKLQVKFWVCCVHIHHIEHKIWNLQNVTNNWHHNCGKKGSEPPSSKIKSLSYTHVDFPEVSTIWCTLPSCVHTCPFNVTGLVCCLLDSNRARRLRFPKPDGRTSLKNSSAMSPSSSTRNLSEYHVNPFSQRNTNFSVMTEKRKNTK
jgi:hypothetical protein